MKITKQAVSKELGKRADWYDRRTDHKFYDTRIIVDPDGDLYAVAQNAGGGYPAWIYKREFIAAIDITDEILSDWWEYGKRFAVKMAHAMLQEAVDEALEAGEVGHE